MYLYPEAAYAVSNTNLRYNFYAVIISILSYLALDNKKGVKKFAIGFIFIGALIDLPFRIFGIYGRDKGESIMIIISFFLSLIFYIYKDKSTDGN